MSSPEIRGLLFDKDGTLIDFNATWSVVMDRLLDELAPDAETRVPMGRAAGYDPEARRFMPGSAIAAGTVEDTVRLWAAFRPDLDLRYMIDRSEEVAAETVASGALIPVHENIAEIMADLAGAGFRLGVATNDSEAAARQHLEAAGILDAFEFISGADSGHGAKPGPGMLLGFARATGLDPLEIAMIGDSMHDIVSAEQAGMRIGVLTGPALREDLEHAADVVLESIAGLGAMLAARGNRAAGARRFSRECDMA